MVSERQPEVVHVMETSVACHVITNVRVIRRIVSTTEEVEKGVKSRASLLRKGVKSRASLLRKGAKSRVKQDVTNTAVNSFLEDI
jgi:hypothetical protein